MDEVEAEHVRFLDAGRLKLSYTSPLTTECFATTKTTKFQLLERGNKYGVSFLAADQGFVVQTSEKLETACVEYVKRRQEAIDHNFNPQHTEVKALAPEKSVGLGTPAHVLALSLDELHLCVAYGSSVALYEVAELLASDEPTAYYTFTDMEAEQIAWSAHEVGNELQFAVLTHDKQVLICNTSGKQRPVRQTATAASVCWSPNGEFFAVGTVEATVDIFGQKSLECERSLKRPDCCDEEFEAHHVNWAEEDLILVGYKKYADEETTAQACLFEAGEVVELEEVVAFYDVENRQHQFYSVFLPEWRMFFVACSLSADIELLVANEESGEWQVWKPSEKYQARLPMNANDEESYPLGMKLSLNSTQDQTTEDKKFPPSPILACVTTEGLLINLAFVDMTVDQLIDWIQPPLPFEATPTRSREAPAEFPPLSIGAEPLSDGGVENVPAEEDSDDDIEAEMEEERETARSVFDQLDTQQQGYLEVGRFAELIEAMGTTYCEEEHSKYAKKLANGTGKVEKATFVEWYVDWVFGDDDSVDESTEEEDASAGSPKPTPNLSDMFRMKEGTWRCEVCCVQNPDPNAAACASCETPNPNAKPSTKVVPAATSAPGFTFQAPSTSSTPPFTFSFDGKPSSTTPSGAPSFTFKAAAKSDTSITPSPTGGFVFGSQSSTHASSTTGSGFQFDFQPPSAEAKTESTGGGFQFTSGNAFKAAEPFTGGIPFGAPSTAANDAASASESKESKEDTADQYGQNDENEFAPSDGDDTDDDEERREEEEKAKNAFKKVAESGENFMSVNKFEKLFNALGSVYCEEEHGQVAAKLEKDGKVFQDDFIRWYLDWLFADDEDESDDEDEDKQPPKAPEPLMKSKEEIAAAMAKWKPAEGSWKCSVCMVQNTDPNAAACSACETANPNAPAEAKASSSSPAAAGSISSAGFVFPGAASGFGFGASSAAKPATDSAKSGGFNFSSTPSSIKPPGTFSFSFSSMPSSTSPKSSPSKPASTTVKPPTSAPAYPPDTSAKPKPPSFGGYPPDTSAKPKPPSLTESAAAKPPTSAPAKATGGYPPDTSAKPTPPSFGGYPPDTSAKPKPPSFGGYPPDTSAKPKPPSFGGYPPDTSAKPKPPSFGGYPPDTSAKPKPPSFGGYPPDTSAKPKPPSLTESAPAKPPTSAPAKSPGGYPPDTSAKPTPPSFGGYPPDTSAKPKPPSFGGYPPDTSAKPKPPSFGGYPPDTSAKPKPPSFGGYPPDTSAKPKPPSFGGYPPDTSAKAAPPSFGTASSDSAAKSTSAAAPKSDAESKTFSFGSFGSAMFGANKTSSESSATKPNSSFSFPSLSKTTESGRPTSLFGGKSESSKSDAAASSPFGVVPKGDLKTSFTFKTPPPTSDGKSAAEPSGVGAKPAGAFSFGSTASKDSSDSPNVETKLTFGQPVPASFAVKSDSKSTLPPTTDKTKATPASPAKLPVEVPFKQPESTKLATPETALVGQLWKLIVEFDRAVKRVNHNASHLQTKDEKFVTRFESSLAKLEKEVSALSADIRSLDESRDQIEKDVLFVIGSDGDIHEQLEYSREIFVSFKDENLKKTLEEQPLDQRSEETKVTVKKKMKEIERASAELEKHLSGLHVGIGAPASVTTPAQLFRVLKQTYDNSKLQYNKACQLSDMMDKLTLRNEKRSQRQPGAACMLDGDAVASSSVDMTEVITESDRRSSEVRRQFLSLCKNSITPRDVFSGQRRQTSATTTPSPSQQKNAISRLMPRTQVTVASPISSVKSGNHSVSFKGTPVKSGSKLFTLPEESTNDDKKATKSQTAVGLAPQRPSIAMFGKSTIETPRAESTSASLSDAKAKAPAKSTGFSFAMPKDTTKPDAKKDQPGNSLFVATNSLEPKPKAKAPASTAPAPAPLKPTTEAASSAPKCDYKAKLTKFYEEFNASKLSSVDKTLEDFKGREEALFTRLFSKYLPESTDEDVKKYLAGGPVPKKSAASIVPAATLTADDKKGSAFSFSKPATPAEESKKTDKSPFGTISAFGGSAGMFGKPAESKTTSTFGSSAKPAETKPTSAVGAASKPDEAQPTSAFGAPAKSAFSFPSSTATPAPQTGSATNADYRKRLVEFYQKHNPAKLSEVDATLAKYKGKEDKLFHNLAVKYKTGEAGTTTAPPSGSLFTSSPKPNPSASPFGNPSSFASIGSPAQQKPAGTASAFGAANPGASPFGTSAFGGSPSSAPSTSTGFGFGNPSSTPAFGSTGATAGNTSAFGGFQQNAPAAPAFGAPSAFGTAAGGFGAATGTENHRERLVKFYQQFNPDKLKDVDSTLEKYKGNEQRLFAMLEQKYLKKPAAPAAGGIGGASAFGGGFGATAPLGNAAPAFGSASALGGTSAPAFGSSSALGSTAAPFGTPSRLGGASGGFGAFSSPAPAAGASTPGTGFGAFSSQGASFGSAAPSGGSGFGSFGGAAAGGFGQPSAFGSSSFTQMR
ncbi:TPA: hypothetical protein N0F65_012321 [Lagenidium giganteum]|uniref:RanBP2-type domain-containing protein n=1 Tax=Lagenidium giganteum TaxID=4803 RepID=A0AAV2YTQ1_9STRA|nr:TPA: hypothetical protein N0F65_012321 [Lagenidium giganteum]